LHASLQPSLNEAVCLQKQRTVEFVQACLKSTLKPLLVGCVRSPSVQQPAGIVAVGVLVHV
jgi:hypothetical protein